MLSIRGLMRFQFRNNKVDWVEDVAFYLVVIIIQDFALVLRDTLANQRLHRLFAHPQCVMKLLVVTLLVV